MSEKWRRSKAWDNANFPKWALPAKILLRAFSSIPLAICFLAGVAAFGISASIPIGMLALIPTYVVYALSFVLAVLVLAGLPVVLVRRLLRGSPRGARFVVTFLGAIALIPFAVVAWQNYVWPSLLYDPVNQNGVRFFAEFCEKYAATTLRRLPGIEMSELEYYAWWPMSLMLGLFVVNMVTATVRRIEFNFKNIGVLTVHSGIVTIALGSVYYNGLKKEGDTLLLAGEVNPTSGMPSVGSHQFVFYDNTTVSLYVDQYRGWEQRPLEGVPRYNDYDLGVLGTETAWEKSGRERLWLVDEEGRKIVPRNLSLDVIQPLPEQSTVDPDLRFRIVGYAAYAKVETDWVPLTDPRMADIPPTQDEGPLRLVYLHSGVADNTGVSDYRKPAYVFTLAPFLPKDRVATTMDGENNPILSIEYTLGANLGMSEERWRDVTTVVPQGTKHALIVEIPSTTGGETLRKVVPIRMGEAFDFGGYAFDVQQLSSTPIFPIITKGFENSSSAMVVVRIKNPEGKRVDRWVYARFPQINQDLDPDDVAPSGMPRRGPTDPAIRVALIETDHLAVHIDEPAVSEGTGVGAGTTRASIRLPDGSVRTYSGLEAGNADEAGLPGEWVHDLLGTKGSKQEIKLGLRVGEKYARAARVDRPTQVAGRDREKQFVGTHDKAMMAVEVRVESGPAGPDDAEFKRVLWLPFNKYMGDGLSTSRSVTLPGSRVVRVAFGRHQHQFPNFELKLVDFQMLAYDHRGAPRDYQSIIRVTPTDKSFDQFEHVTRLNTPLTAPYHWSPERTWVENLGLRLMSGLSPHQYKLSQAGWDRVGWDESQAMVDRGLLKAPHAKFTILGVGNNPGIHVIAFGAVLISLGIPWAFYVKPLLVKRESAKIRAQVLAGTYVRPVRVEAVARGETTSASAQAAGGSAGGSA